jgi:hypothetical protein
MKIFSLFVMFADLKCTQKNTRKEKKKKKKQTSKDIEDKKLWRGCGKKST